MALLTPGVEDDGERISASAYGRLQTPAIGPSAMTRLFQRGMPGYPGKDAHGRDCRLVNPAEADLWRATYCTPKLGPDGQMRGLPPSGGSSGKAKTPNPPFVAVAPEQRVKAELAQKREPIPRGAVPDPDDPGGAQSKAERLAEARASSAEDEAATRRLKRLDVEGVLMDRQAGLDVVAGFAGEVGKMLDRAPETRAVGLASALGVEPHAAFTALRDVMEDMRADLERYARSALGDLRSAGRGRLLADDSAGDQAEPSSPAA